MSEILVAEKRKRIEELDALISAAIIEYKKCVLEKIRCSHHKELWPCSQIEYDYYNGISEKLSESCETSFSKNESWWVCIERYVKKFGLHFDNIYYIEQSYNDWNQHVWGRTFETHQKFAPGGHGFPAEITHAHVNILYSNIYPLIEEKSELCRECLRIKKEIAEERKSQENEKAESLEVLKSIELNTCQGTLDKHNSRAANLTTWILGLVAICGLIVGAAKWAANLL